MNGRATRDGNTRSASAAPEPAAPSGTAVGPPPARSSPADDAAPDAPVRGTAADEADDAAPDAAPGDAGGADAAQRLLARLFGATVATAAAFDDHAPADLFPEEAERVANAVDRRRREFATVRRCARTALARLGVPPVPILPGQRGAPNWPDGIVGTMTHCDGFRGAVVARATEYAALGVDAEPNEPLPNDGVREVVTLPAERARFPLLTERRPDVCWDRLVFCAKESVFKCWYPLTRSELDFTEAEIVLDTAGTFTARLLVPGPVVAGAVQQSFHGRWAAGNGLLVAAIALPAHAPSDPPGDGAPHAAGPTAGR